MKILSSMIALAFLTVGFQANAADGQAVYSKECAKCHGADGKGQTAVGKKLKVKDLTVEQSKLSDAQITKAIKDGVEEGGKQVMKPVKDLSDADVQAVVKYVRTLK